jgi:hypothetical protein
MNDLLAGYDYEKLIPFIAVLIGGGLVGYMLLGHAVGALFKRLPSRYLDKIRLWYTGTMHK